MTRRHLLHTISAGALTASGALRAVENPTAKRLGIGSSSYGIRRGYERKNSTPRPIANPIYFLEYCHSIGAGGIQTSLSSLDSSSQQRALRHVAERYGMYVEATLGLPHDKADLGDFKHNVRIAKNAGATVIRTAMLSGRRYETFDTAEAFKEFAERQWFALTQAEPILRNHSMKLAIENHKDWRLDEMLILLQKISSEFIGVCVDTGNNIALLDNPMDLVASLAPYAHSVHLKDMGVEEYEDGFLLSEVPLGEGYLDIPKMVKVLREAKPDLQFSLEMITRDPLTIPCLTKKYWATFEDLPGSDLARTLATVRANKPAKPLPRVSHLNEEQRRDAEEENVRKCLAYAREHLSL